MLIGGSKEDNLFQIPNLEQHLDLMQEVGANYMRNTMSSRDEGNVHPFKKLDNGKYDLDQWNPDYWNRFRRMLELTAEREIFVQIELWDQWDYNRGRWDDNPWNPEQNVNYSVYNTQLNGNGHYKEVDAILGQPRRPDKPVESIKGAGKMDFFLTVPGLENDKKVLSYQKRFIDKLLSYSLKYGHVLYTITNELFMQHSPEWSRYWARYLRAKAQNKGVRIHVTEMLHNHDIRHEQHRACFDHPEFFSFVDISQNSLQNALPHWKNLQWVRSYISNHPRPINHVKTYGAPDHSISRFWRNLLGGAASCRFHRPPAGIGLNREAQVHLESMRMWLEAYNIFSGQPFTGYSKSEDKVLVNTESPLEAVCHYQSGEQYSVYFSNGGEVGLNLPKGTYQLKWLNIENNEWWGKKEVKGGKELPLRAPDDGHWLALIKRTN